MFSKQICRSCKNFGGYLISTMRIHGNSKSMSNNQFTEVNIDLPWGKVAGKHWNPHVDKQPILALHGFMDNASTFDMLAPLLKDFPVLAIDLPGHGLSSWLPPGIPYNEAIFIQTIRLIRQHFGWNQTKLMGHSFGGVMCFNYAILYPEDTKFVVSIDSLGFFSSLVEEHCKKLANGIDKLIAFEKKRGTPPSYSEEEVIKRWMEATVFKSLDVKSTKTLMTRGAKKNENNKYSITRDYRLSFKGFDVRYSNSDILEAGKLIKNPYFVLRASETVYPRKEKYWSDLEKVMTKTCKEFVISDIEGKHHVHMTHPEETFKKIIPFLEKYDT